MLSDIYWELPGLNILRAFGTGVLHTYASKELQSRFKSVSNVVDLCSLLLGTKPEQTAQGFVHGLLWENVSTDASVVPTNSTKSS